MKYLSNTRPGSSSRKLLFVVVAIALLALVFVIDVRRREAEEQLKNLTVRLEQLQTGNSQQNQEAARRVVDQVRKLISIPEDVVPTVATIIDVESLREQNPFYNSAENGDHLVVTPERAILFSTEKNIILDVVPVQIQPTEGGLEGDVTGTPPAATPPPPPAPVETEPAEPVETEPAE
ncbi:hypothetical protein HN512_01030 [Candidatus Peregrinibacteria bacterium]|jgi:hypothetical protein|nr:hypothetical protein [Candidatus Peregrinibacteria bacterium]MBT3598402.1 hypothetical protein [Candidatus Peregrinibacteria bacterium]MBT4367439.1 hypothetical protein [Candidatus Peregrinibacteria bacterium]MBT4585673.1 hypothetical protein [Candidatus Peregrinibacteria bacterium]MBT6730439.1 hypothetical protein [Candidatus Peregrinibacteria bacterium]